VGARGSALHLSDYMLGLLGKFMCYAICALAMDLIWGYTGILSLGHGLFFAGRLCDGHVPDARGRRPDALPAFMGFLDWKELPWHWALSGSFAATVLLVFLVPGLIGGCSATSPFARASRACISPSSPRP
jgi:urea transport system permease protein